MTEPRRRLAKLNDIDGLPLSPRIIDTKLPLTWLIGTAGTIVMSLLYVAISQTTLSNKVESLLLYTAESKINVAELRAKQEIERDARFALQRDIDSVKNQQGELKNRIDEHDRAIRGGSKK